jgi:hypothetical protein
VEDSIVTGGERFRHETQLDKGPHPDGEKKVPDAIYIEEGVKELFPMTDKSSHVI